MHTTIVADRPARARLLAALVILLALLVPAAGALAQEEDEDLIGLAEIPTTGAARPGPIAPVAVVPVAPAEVEGVAPVAIQIDKIGVDAPVEVGEIVDGVMQDPTGPWVVTWYQELAALGEESNVVMAGHVDYWNVGPAVFWGFKDPGLAEGDLIRVIAEDGEVYEYEVQWVENYDVATELTPEVIQEEIVVDTDEEALTLITCGGEFNYETGEYLQRVIVRAVKV